MPRFHLGFPKGENTQRSSQPSLFARFFGEVRSYFVFIYKYIRRRGYYWFSKFESGKDVVVAPLYKQRGKYSRPLLHFGTITLIFMVITFGPLILDQTRRQEEQSQAGSSGVLNQLQAYGEDLSTIQSEEVRAFRGGEIHIHRVQEGETLSSIAKLYNLNRVETITWENNLPKNATLKPGQELRILPVDGIRHKVARGETIYTLAKKYDLGDDAVDAQKIVNYPFNEFKNSETFELAIGQTILIPDGVKPEERATVSRVAFGRVMTPDAGSVSAVGSFIWPASGRITQGYSFYHKAFDIANLGGGPILAADSGTVVAAGWDISGYGNRVLVDHGNGFNTLYGHMSLLQVQVGQKVARGNVIGQMGSTGRSTGVHLHFEVRRGGVLENPGNFLR
ncbi:M23 family metallopeptidase [Patescibacteria group bacterium]|nr:M23 family metallopeptidase [Patescibacteria group bacterium]